MKKMQKVFALILTASMIFAVLAGCSKRDPEDRGAHIHMYLAADPSNLNLDPAKMLYSAEAVKFIGLIFEGLTVMDDSGKLQGGMAKKWTVIEDDENNIYKMQFEIKDTKWSDGIPVSADDFCYAWKRILEPEFTSPAAPLLYYIKNARAVKEGDMTIDDLGVVALDEKLLEITFERKIDYDMFLKNLASIALVPVRSDTVDYAPDTWAMQPLTLLTNGPFSIKTMEYNRGVMMERSIYYLLDTKKGEDIMKYVKPYRIYLDFSRSLDSITDSYVNRDMMFFLGNVPKARFGEFENKAIKKDMLSTYSLHFNVAKTPLDRAEVRQALSIALDRNNIASLIGLGVKPATGIVPTGTIGEKATTDFRNENGELINPTGDMDKARQLLQSAGVSSGSFSIKVRNTASERELAEYIAGIWGQLGFTVNVVTAQGRAYSDDIFNVNYDVMAYDAQSTGVDAYSVLAPFAMPFSGGVVRFLDEGESDVTPYITGFQNDAYDALIEEIFLIDDNKTRHEKLQEAERLLVELSPIAPLYFNTSINITEDISGITYSKFGFPVFTRANLRNYLDYTTTAAPREPVN